MPILKSTCTVLRPNPQLTLTRTGFLPGGAKVMVCQQPPGDPPGEITINIRDCGSLRKKTTCKDCYTIKSLYYEDALLYSVSSRDQNYKLNHPRRPVYTYRGKHSFPGSRGEDIWKIETVSDYSDRVRIKNKRDDDKKYEYLYATDDRVHDDKRRNVFTWSSNENLNANRWDGVGDWILERAECPSYAKEERY